MNQWLLHLRFSLVLIFLALPLYGQFTDPRNYTNSPVGLNQIELLYAYGRSNTSIDSSLVVGGATFRLDQGVVTFTRYFGLLGRLAWIEPSVPTAGLSGSIKDTNISGTTVGMGDSSYQLGMLVKGGPALGVTEYEHYKPTTSLGVSLTVTAPTGKYNQDKLLNLGTARWSFKPEVGVCRPFGREQRWEIDAYANSYIFTDNTTYRGVEVLRQEPLPGLEGHLSYTLSKVIWASFDARYSFRGDTEVNGVDQNNSQRNFIVGSELNFALNPHSTMVFVFAKAAIHHNGPSIGGFAIRYDYTWGKGYK